jgi:hypothetical protein
LRSVSTSTARIAAVFASLTIVFVVSTAVRAGTLPDISGTWYANGNPAAPCHITQSGRTVSLSNEQGTTATGHFVDPSTLSTDWGLTNGGQITGKISGDLRRIDWSNGTYWSRPNTAPLVPAATPTPRPTSKPTPVPLRVSVMPIPNNESNPIHVYAASLTNGYQAFTAQQCVSYRNVTTKVATRVDFSFYVTNRSGGPEQQFDWSDVGTFTPPVNIENHCVTGRLAAPDVVRRMAYETITLKQVTFSDGTVWTPGTQYVRGYTTSGEPTTHAIVQTQGNRGSNAGGGLLTAGPYRLRTAFTGSEKCLDIVNDGINNRLTMATCGVYTGQMWWAENVAAGQARLKNMFTGSDKCLDVINDGRDNRLRMAACGNHTGQMWWAQKVTSGQIRLKNLFSGSGECLDIINDGRNNRLTMATCGNYSGQLWNVGH